jgi:23S rRNA (guanosine2251-2'-O)-methyltransferase
LRHHRKTSAKTEEIDAGQQRARSGKKGRGRRGDKTGAAGEILYGIHPVAEALHAGRRSFQEIAVSNAKHGARIGEILALAEKRNIPVSSRPEEDLDRLSKNEAHQGITARVSPYAAWDWKASAEPSNQPSIFLLADSVTDTQNLGALVRSALCAGVKAVVIPKDRSAAPTPAVSKTSAGALEHTVLYRVTNLVYAMKDLKKRGVWTIGLDASAPSSIYETDFRGSVALVIGGEETGLRPLVKRECDFLASIPMAPAAVNSLNASAAGAIVMYEAYRQQKIAARQ